MEEYQLRDDVRGVQISPVTSADTVYLSDRRLSGVIGEMQTKLDEIYDDYLTASSLL